MIIPKYFLFGCMNREFLKQYPCCQKGKENFCIRAGGTKAAVRRRKPRS